MDINIFTGDNYNPDNSIWIDLGINVLGTFLGFLGAYWIYCRQIKNERNNKLSEQNEELKTHAEFIKFLIQDIINYQLIQQEHYKTFSEQLIANPSKPEKLVVTTNCDTDRLLKLENELTFMAFKQIYIGAKERLYNDYKNIFTCIFYLNEINMQAKEVYSDKIISIIGGYEENYKTTVQDISNFLALTLKSLKQNNPEKYKDLAEYIQLDKIFGQYQAIIKSPTEIQTIQDGFVNPLKKYIIENQPYADYSNYILTYSKNATVYLSDIKHYSFTFSEYYKEAYESSKDKTDKLTNFNSQFPLQNAV